MRKPRITFRQKGRRSPTGELVISLNGCAIGAIWCEFIGQSSYRWFWRVSTDSLWPGSGSGGDFLGDPLKTADEAKSDAKAWILKQLEPKP